MSQQILNEAQGDHVPDYQGYRAFWLLPIEEFKTVKIYGQPMIDPALDQTAGKAVSTAGCHCAHCEPAQPAAGAEPNCWPSTASGAAPQHAGEKPSDRSGLIKGLRGEYSFDGSMFPPLLWGPTAQKISASDIELIAAWIDDGCPTSDEEAPESNQATPTAGPTVVSSDHLMARAYGDAPHPTSNKHINAIRDDVSGASVMTWRSMILATLAGSLPVTLMYALTGATAANFDRMVLPLGLALLMAGLF